MKNSARAPEIADPYATLETILKIIGRSWLTEEWRLEDVRILAQAAIVKRQEQGKTKESVTQSASSQTQAKHPRRAYPQALGSRNESMPLSP